MSATDRELLEAAARAASGKPLRNYAESGIKADEWIIRDDGFVLAPTLAGHAIWNPLADDGDALRLAVKLRLHVDTHRSGGVTAWVLADEGARDFDEYQANPYAATRRAIVRAAASIAGTGDAP